MRPYASGLNGAGWSSLVARRAHNPKVAGSNPAPATKTTKNPGISPGSRRYGGRFEPGVLGCLRALFGLGATLGRTSLRSLPSRSVQIPPPLRKRRRTRAWSPGSRRYGGDSNQKSSSASEPCSVSESPSVGFSLGSNAAVPIAFSHSGLAGGARAQIPLLPSSNPLAASFACDREGSSLNSGRGT